MDSQNCVAVPNGNVCYNGTTAGSVANYTCDNRTCDNGTCDNGNGTTRTCRSDGRWDGEIPACGNNNYIIGIIIIYMCNFMDTIIANNIIVLLL